MRLKSLTFVVALLFAVAAPKVSAIPLSYTIDSWDATVDSPFDIVVLAEPLPFILDDLQEQTFDFFTIGTTASRGRSDINTTINFTVPLQLVTIPGVVDGENRTNFTIDFSNPGPFVLADRTFTVTLSEPVFERSETVTVTATIKQLSSVASVPDGGNTVLLLGLAALTIGLVQRLRVARH